MFCKLLKLTNGESLIVTTDDACDSFAGKEFLDVVDPVQVGTIRVPRGNMIIESYVLQPWIRMAKADLVKIPVHNIIVAVDLQDQAKEQYEDFVKTSGKIEFTPGGPDEVPDIEPDEMEEIFNSVMLNDDEEEDDGYTHRKNTRSVH